MDDEKIYNEILEELRANGPRQGLWAKCFTEAKGNENTAKALYFKYRAQQLVQQKEATPPKSDSTDLVNHSLTSLKKESQQESIYKNIALYVMVLFILIPAVFWLLDSSLNDKATINAVKNNQAKEAEVKALVVGALATVERAAVERNKTLQAAVDAKQIADEADTLKSKAHEYEIAGKAIEKELATKLHLFKYELKDGEKTLYYSKDKINFYPLDYKYSNIYSADNSLESNKILSGNPIKNEPNVEIYSIGSRASLIIELYFKDKNSNYFRSLYGGDGRQDFEIKFNGNLIELKYKGYAKNDSRAGPSIPVSKTFQYINGEMVCTGGNCEYKNFE